MSLNDPFYHDNPVMTNLMISAYRAVKHQNRGELILPRRDYTPLELADCVRGKFDRKGSKAFRNFDRHLPMLAEAVDLLTANGVLRTKKVNKGLDTALAAGTNAPDKLPELRKYTRTKSKAVRRTERTPRANRVPAYR